MLFGSLAFYGLFTTIVCAVVSSKKTYASFRTSLVINGVISFLYCWAIFSSAYYLSYFLFWLGGERLFRTQRSRTWIWMIAIVAGIIGHTAIGLTFGLWHVYEIKKIEESLPVYPVDETSFARSAYPATPLIEVDEEPSFSRESYHFRNLQTIHRSTIEHFIHAPSFGVGRMLTFNLQEYQKHRSEFKPYPQNGRPLLVEDLDDWIPLSGGVTDDLHDSHRQFRRDFADPNSLGVERNHKQIVGFERHGAKSNLSSNSFQPKNSPYRFRSVELVGLLITQEPRVYQTKNLPTMNEATTAPTRVLDAFETKGLSEIAAGQSMWAMESGDGLHVRMVGAIRANSTCLKCHDCRSGDLLGLMSYTIEKPSPSSREKSPKSP